MSLLESCVNVPSDSEEEDNDESWEDVEADSGNLCDQRYSCLKCSSILETEKEFFEHLTIKHGVVNFLDSDHLFMIKDQYDWIRFVNYFRKNVS